MCQAHIEYFICINAFSLIATLQSVVSLNYSQRNYSLETLDDLPNVTQFKLNLSSTTVLCYTWLSCHSQESTLEIR